MEGRIWPWKPPGAAGRPRCAPPGLNEGVRLNDGRGHSLMGLRGLGLGLALLVLAALCGTLPALAQTPGPGRIVRIDVIGVILWPEGGEFHHIREVTL